MSGQVLVVFGISIFVMLLIGMIVHAAFRLGALEDIRLGLYAADPADAQVNHRLTLIGDEVVREKLIAHVITFTGASTAIALFAYALEAGAPTVGVCGLGCAIMALDILVFRSRERRVAGLSARFTDLAGFTPSEGRERVLGPRPEMLLPR